MTKEELLNGLEGLKDLVNDGGKSQINTFKAAVREMVPDLNPDDQPVNAQPVTSKFMGRNNTAYDPGSDQ